MERILSGTLSKKGKIPGADERESEHVRYVSFDGKVAPKKDFRKITRHVSPPIPESGAVMLEPCIIKTPDGILFYSLYFNGDIEGWRQQIENGAIGTNRTWAKIQNQTFICSNGKSFELSECQPKFAE